jgi:SAM dependent carboxyl methyltransferase
VKQSDVDSFNLPVYLPSIEEVKSIIQMEGSFEIIQHDVSDVLYNDCVDVNSDDGEENLMKLVKTYQAMFEHLFISHFGASIIDPLISIIPKIFAKHFVKEESKSASIAISLKKK